MESLAMRNPTKFLAVLLSISFLALSAAVAQTPDGDPPAEESVCDPLLGPGITPGLYGLCVAYCEAHDADDVSDLEAVCNPSDDKILDNYNRKKTDMDPPMPCRQPDCPCWTIDDITLLTIDDPDGCRRYTCGEKTKFDADGLLVFLDTRIDMKREFARVYGTIAPPNKPAGKCSYRYQKIRRNFEVTWAEAQACRDILHADADVGCFD
jgi:hypothetical protein